MAREEVLYVINLLQCLFRVFILQCSTVLFSFSAYLLKSWKVKHSTGQMTYSNGYLTVGQTGYYYIYCQLYSVDGAPTLYRFSLYVGSNEVLKAVKSIISSTKRRNTTYIGGVFHISAGQTISVRTQNKNLFSYSSTESYFGAFMIHP